MSGLKNILFNIAHTLVIGSLLTSVSCQESWERTGGFCVFDQKQVYYVGGDVPGKKGQSPEYQIQSLDLSDNNNFSKPNWKGGKFNLTTPYTHTSGDILNGKIYFYGVSDSLYSGKVQQKETDDLFMFTYDTSSGKFESKKIDIAPQSRSNHQFKSIDGSTLWSYGGLPPDSNKIGYENEKVVLFDTKTMKWKQVDITPFVIYSFTATLLDKKLILIGGSQNADMLYSMKNIKYFDLVSNNFADIALQSEVVPKSRVNHMAAVKDGKIYIYGGSNADESEFYNDLWELDLKKQTWTEITSPEIRNLPGRAYGCFGLIGNEFVVTQGHGSQKSLPIAKISISNAQKASGINSGPNSEDGSSGMSDSAKIGIGFGVAAIVALMCGGIFWWHHKKKSRNNFFTGKSYMAYMEFNNSYTDPIWSDPYTRRASFCTVRDLAEGDTTPESQMDETITSTYQSNLSTTQPHLFSPKNTLPSVYSTRDRSI